MPGVSVYPHLCATSEPHWLWISMQHFCFPTLIENIARNYYYGILTGSWFCYHLAQACQFIFSLSLVFPLVRLFLSCGASRREKGRAVSFLLFKIQQARYCWELPLFSCSCLFSFHLSRSSLVEDGEKTATYTPFLTHRRAPGAVMFRMQSWAHQGTFLCICGSTSLISVLNWVEERPCVRPSVDQIKSFQWSPPGSWLCVRSADSGRARQTSGDAPVTPWSLLWCVASKDVHI